MATWNLDTAHSEVQFKVRHMMVSNVSGYFRNFSGTLTAEADDLNDAQFDFEAQIDSIDTRQADRDGHLKSPDFFDAANHPALSFNSTSVQANGEDWIIKGEPEFDLIEFVRCRCHRISAWFAQLPSTASTILSISSKSKFQPLMI